MISVFSVFVDFIQLEKHNRVLQKRVHASARQRAVDAHAKHHVAPDSNTSEPIHL